MTDNNQMNETMKQWIPFQCGAWLLLVFAAVRAGGAQEESNRVSAAPEGPAPALQREPAYQYDFSDPRTPLDVSRSRLRRIEHQGRTGIHVMDSYGALTLPNHTCRAPQGSVAMWVLFLDDLRGRITEAPHRMNNPLPDLYPLIGDRANMASPDAAHFSLYYSASGGPQLHAKFFPGSWHECLLTPNPCALAFCEYWAVERLRWYHLVVTWDHPRSRYEIYANGIHIGTSDHSLDGPRKYARSGPLLYIGNPSVVYSRVEFYDQALPQEESSELFVRQGGDAKTGETVRLQRQTAGEGLPPFTFSPGDGWTPRLEVSLTDPGDMQNFQIQGNVGAATVTGQGLEVKTPSWEEYLTVNRASEPFRQIQFYLWSREVFDGDLYVRFEFQTKNRTGLALLMSQAAGMQGEDFLECHAPRTSGKMETVIREDVRNYHWEFYRDMYDTRCDRASHYLCKNPWSHLVAYQLEPRTWETSRWYRVEYLQESEHVRCAIDGVTVLDWRDAPDRNMGPVLLNGHIALRCMVRSHVLFRNLSVHSRPAFGTSPVRLPDGKQTTHP